MSRWRGDVRGITIGFLVFFAALILSCKRTETPYAGAKKEKTDGLPKYTVVANDGESSKVTYISAVLPQGEEVIDGKAIFATNCSACHQLTGMGIPGAFPPLNKSPYVLSDNTERFAAIVLYGLQGEISVLGAKYNSAMAPLGSVLNDAKAAAAISYVRSAWDNRAGPVTPEVVAKVRQKYGTRGMFSIKDLGEEK